MAHLFLFCFTLLYLFFFSSLRCRSLTARVVHVNSVLIARGSAVIGYFNKARNFHSTLVREEFLSNEAPNLFSYSERMARIYFAIFTPYLIIYLYTLCKVQTCNAKHYYPMRLSSIFFACRPSIFIPYDKFYMYVSEKNLFGYCSS